MESERLLAKRGRGRRACNRKRKWLHPNRKWLPEKGKWLPERRKWLRVNNIEWRGVIKNKVGPPTATVMLFVFLFAVCVARVYGSSEAPAKSIAAKSIFPVCKPGKSYYMVHIPGSSATPPRSLAVPWCSKLISCS